MISLEERNVTELSNKIRTSLEDVKGGEIVVFVLSSNSYSSFLSAIVCELSRAATGIYVSLNQSYQNLCAQLKKEKVNTNKIYIIEGVSKSKEEAEADNCTYLKSRSLTELSIAITSATNTGKFDYLIFDSLSTLIMYNELKTIEKFAHYILQKIKTYKLKGIIVALDEERSKELIAVSSQFCDKVIEIK